MSVRTLRRTFASPFVLTLATIPAACMVQSAPPRGGGQPPQQQSYPTDPQQPQQQPDQSMQRPAEAMPHQGVEQTQGPTPSPMSNPPRPGAEQATAPSGDRHWTVMKQGDRCVSHAKAVCPPNAMCNPPPPKAYACTPEVTQNAPLKIVQWAGQKTCQIETEPMNCPRNASCNPPRPQQVTCPSD